MKSLFEINDFERSLCAGPVKIEIRADGVAEALENYLPWDHVDIAIKKQSGADTWLVVDNQTDFKYEIRRINENRDK